eukprot:SAG31_NODE_226_length_19837_cov_4.368730_5_plen_63_part_00
MVTRGEEMAHKKEHGKTKPLRVAGLPGPYEDRGLVKPAPILASRKGSVRLVAWVSFHVLRPD